MTVTPSWNWHVIHTLDEWRSRDDDDVLFSILDIPDVLDDCTVLLVTDPDNRKNSA